MTPHDFSQRVQALVDRAARMVPAEPVADPALAELQVALEELQVAEEELRQQNEELMAARESTEAERRRYQDLFEFAPDAYLVTDNQGMICEANTSAFALFAIEPAILRKPMALHVVAEDRRHFRAELARCLASTMKNTFELRLCHRSGAVMDMEATVAPIRADSGRATGLRWLLRDTSDRKRAEREIRSLNTALNQRVEERTGQLETAQHLTEAALLREQAARATAEAGEDRLRFLAEAGRVLAFSLDLDVTLANLVRLVVPGLADWCAVDLLEENGSVVLHAAAHRDPARTPLIHQLTERFPENPEGTSGVPGVLHTGQPEMVKEAAAANVQPPEKADLLEQLGCHARLLVPLSAGNRTIGVLTLGKAGPPAFGAANIDLALELARRAGLAIAHARLYRGAQEADQRKKEFLAMLAHELRNPLAPVRNSIYVLRNSDNDPAARARICSIIEHQVQHMTRLVDDLLDLSRITRGKIELRRAPTLLETIGRRAVEGARPLIEERSHTLTVELPPEPVWLEVDPTRLEQVLVNLLANAAKYTDPRGRIELTAQCQGPELVIRVCDNGIGIAPEFLPHIFDLFSQARQPLGRSRGGLGIGLTLVRNLVEMHGGRVRAHSAGPGKGSEFEIRLPTCRAPQEPRPHSVRSDGAHARPARGHRRVLVVDDNSDAAQTMATLLEMEGHEVATAADGFEALERARSYHPDMVLLDIGLPGMDGHEVARRLRQEEEFKHIVLVALTGFGQLEDKARSRAAGFNHHLVKPVELESLRDVLEKTGAVQTVR
jgi:PAS domain S-box-containing protein